MKRMRQAIGVGNKNGRRQQLQESERMIGDEAGRLVVSTQMGMEGWIYMETQIKIRRGIIRSLPYMAACKRSKRKSWDWTRNRKA